MAVGVLAGKNVIVLRKRIEVILLEKTNRQVSITPVSSAALISKEEVRRDNPNVRPDFRKADLYLNVEYLNNLYRSIRDRSSSPLYFDSDQDNVDFNAIEAELDREAEEAKELLAPDEFGFPRRGADLSGADFSRADLMDSTLTRADLSKANLTNADLGGADLDQVILCGANLTGAYLYKADLMEANLSGAVLEGGALATLTSPERSSLERS